VIASGAVSTQGLLALLPFVNASTVLGVVTSRKSSGGGTNVWQTIVVHYRLG
jgi:hypothetical protein